MTRTPFFSPSDRVPFFRAILATLQIQGVANDPVMRFTARLSMMCALMSLLYGCIYIVCFGMMKLINLQSCRMGSCTSVTSKKMIDDNTDLTFSLGSATDDDGYILERLGAPSATSNVASMVKLLSV